MKLRKMGLTVFCMISGLSMGYASSSSSASHGGRMSHEMQHGFIMSADDAFGSHLVASGHHSRQTEIAGELVIEDDLESSYYTERKTQNHSGASYFLFQAQSLDLPTLRQGQILTGHIVESAVGKYESKNIIVKKATFRVDRVILNLPNPFFL